MKKIGYIHRYDKKKEIGILVYDYNQGPFWNSPVPILFTKKQCNSSIKTGTLVYFEINEYKNVKNIETASIFNFDRELLTSIVSSYESKDWDECEKETHICYQNIANLKEWVFFKTKTTTNENIHESDDNNNEYDPNADPFYLDLEIDDILADLIDNSINSNIDLLDLDSNSIPTGEYRKITIPKSIEEEFKLFGKPFPKEYSFGYDKEICKNQTIIIDILNPSYWIPKIPIPSKKYYGKNTNEFIDLFNILILKRRNAYERHLNNKLGNLSENSRRELYPELLQNNRVSNSWIQLINRFSNQEIKNIYDSCALLQPILPESFCINNLNILNEKYGFPSVYIAEKFYSNTINKITSATEYCYYKELFHNIKKCNNKNIPEEGIKLHSINKKILNNLSRRLSRRLIKVLSHIKEQISHAMPYSESSQYNFFDEYDIHLKLKIGEFYDYIENYFCKKLYIYDFEANDISKYYNALPKESHCLFDSYLSTKFKSEIVNSLTKEELLPFQLNFVLTTFSKWINTSFFDEISEIVNRTFSEITDVSNLIDAYQLKYISEKKFIEKYYELSTKQTELQCLNDLYNSSERFLPDEIQLYILRRALKYYKLKLAHSPYSYTPMYLFPGNDTVSSLNDYLEWINKNTKNRNCGTISKKISEKFLIEATSNLDMDDRWFLFENGFITSPGKDNIKKRLSKGYSNYCLDKKYIDRDCFQQQMADDVLKIENKELIYTIIGKLNPTFRKKIAKNVQGFWKLYLWSIDPNDSIDWEIIKKYFHELPSISQRRVFRYLFLLQSQNKLNSVNDFLQSLTDLLINSITTESFTEIKDNDLLEILDFEGNTLSALSVLVQIIKIKYKSIITPVTFNDIEPLIKKFHATKKTMLVALRHFLYECNGWLLLSYETGMTEDSYYIGYVTDIDTISNDELKYKLYFYDTHLDINGQEIKYLNYSDIIEAEEVLKKNFNVQYDDGGYIISSKDIIRLKEYMTYYHIDDMCNLFDVLHEEHLNLPIKYKENSQFVCNCGLYKDLDPIYGIPYRWCKKEPCTRHFTFLQSDKKWEKFKFADLLWIIMNGKINLNQLWNINSEISSFVNDLYSCDKATILSAKSKPLLRNEEIGKWTEDMEIFTWHSYDDYLYSEDLDYDDNSESYNEQHNKRETYNHYNGFWAQDEEGFSDDDIDNI